MIGRAIWRWFCRHALLLTIGGVFLAFIWIVLHLAGRLVAVLASV